VLAPYEAVTTGGGWVCAAREPAQQLEPVINSNVLAAALLVEPNEPAGEPHAQALRSLDMFLGPHPAAAWTKARLLGRPGQPVRNARAPKSASGGKIDYFTNPVVADIGRYIYRARIADEWFVDVGDSGARVSVDRGLVFAMGPRSAIRAAGDGASGATEDDVDLGDGRLGGR